MSGVFIKDDLRRVKTQKSLFNAFKLLLQKRSFKNITVNDLCVEAYISRSAFYANYKDKYDLLEAVLESIVSNYPLDFEKIMDTVVYDNFTMIVNILDSAIGETMELVNKFMLRCLNLLLKKNDYQLNSPEYIVFSNICAGGVLQHISWQANNQESLNDNKMKDYFISVINYLLKWRK